MDGAECTANLGMVIAGIKIIDPLMNGTLMENRCKLEPIGQDVKFMKPKRETFTRETSSPSSALPGFAAATAAAAVQQPTQGEQPGNEVKRRRLSRRKDQSSRERAPDDENVSAISCQSTQCILLVRFQIGKDDLDTTS